jgi:hypothetical protein
MSWRDQISHAGQDDLDGLLAAVLPLGQKMLAEHGEFFPYGATVSLDGQVRMVAPYDGTEQPRSADLLSLMHDSARAGAEAIRAAAFVFDVRLAGSTPGDAIRVELEHREGIALAVMLPYRVMDGDVEYGNLTAGPAEQRVWGDSN